MPGMPRPNTKATKIAKKIMGTPPNKENILTQHRRYINRRLVFEETVRSK
jgi:hypothetical protein